MASPGLRAEEWTPLTGCGGSILSIANRRDKVDVIMSSYRRPDGSRRRKRRTLGMDWTVLEVLTAKGVVSMCGKLHVGWSTWSVAKGDRLKRMWPDGWSYEELKMPKRKGRRGSAEAATINAPSETKLFAGLPHVIEHLTARTWDDGQPREPGTILVSTKGSTYRLIAKEPDEGMQLVVYMPSHDDAWLQLELLLGSDEAPWEPDPYGKRKAPRAKKK